MSICLNNVCFEYQTKYQRVTAVRDASFQFEARRMYAIMGASGSGKTTLLSMMAGLKLPTSGIVTINGEETSKTDCCKLRRESVSVIYQDFNLFPLLTVEENAAYPLLIRGENKDGAAQTAHEMLQSVGIKEEQYSRLPHMLSGGEQQRVAIARALASGSEIILADEPTGNLDSENSQNIIDSLQKLAHEKDCCVVIVTHDPAVAEAADIVLKMKDGRLIDENPLQREPKSTPAE